MAWSSLASNQMVSYTDAQGGGFTLQPGQSSVTSNQCMTKADALAKYVLNSSYMSSYASNQLVPKSTWVAGVTNSVTFSSWSSQSYTTGSTSTSGTVTIVGNPATFFARATVIASGTTCTTNININGNTRSAYRPTPGTTDSTTFTLNAGTYSYSVSLTNSTGGLAIAGGIVYTQ